LLISSCPIRRLPPLNKNSANVCITSATTNGNLLLGCCLPLREPMVRERWNRQLVSLLCNEMCACACWRLAGESKELELCSSDCDGLRAIGCFYISKTDSRYRFSLVASSFPSNLTLLVFLPGSNTSDACCSLCRRLLDSLTFSLSHTRDVLDIVSF
jgi:hypothetical protein